MFRVVSRCLSVCVCVYVLFGCVVICSCTENGDGDHGVSVVVCHNIVLCCVVAHSNRHAHHEHQHHIAQENSYKHLDSHFQNETDISDGSEGERTPSFFIYNTE